MKNYYSSLWKKHLNHILNVSNLIGKTYPSTTANTVPKVFSSYGTYLKGLQSTLRLQIVKVPII